MAETNFDFEVLSPDAYWQSDAWKRMQWESHRPADMPTVGLPAGEQQMAREMFTTLSDGFGMKVREPQPEFLHHGQFWERMESWEDWQDLKSLCSGDPDVSAGVTKKLMERVAEMVAENPPPPEPEPGDGDGEGESTDGQPGGKTGQWMRDLMKQDGANKGLANLAGAIEQAKKEVQDAKDLTDLMGWGNQPGDMTKGDIQKALQLAQKLDVRKFMDLLGRLHGIITSELSSRVNTSNVQISDYDLGDNLNLVVPSEYLKPSVIFMDDYLQRRLVEYEIRTPPGNRDGPFLVAIDKSGSMGGPTWEIAQAVSLSIAFLANRQGREAQAYLFDCEVRGPFNLHNVGEALDSMMVQPSGGTSYDAVMEKLMPRLLEDRRKDLVLITDGYCDLSDEHRQVLQREDVRLFVVGVGGGIIESLSDVWEMGIIIDNHGRISNASELLRGMCK